MATDKQKAASRANGALSRGPKTAEGKARSARSQISSGLFTQAILLKGESRERFEEIVEALRRTLKPTNPVDELLIGKMAIAHWRQVRLLIAEKDTGKSHDDQEMRLDRQFFRSFDRYVRLRDFFDPPNLGTATKHNDSDPAEPETEPGEPETEPAAASTEPSLPEVQSLP
jgi:tRNA G18 (ribose-2'-O)-methylase SpoU